MRTIRGLQITSIVVLSPVLLIMLSLISMLLFSIYSQLSSWLFQTTQVQQQLLFIRNISTDIAIPRQRTNKQYNHTIVKRARLFSRLRQSPITWTIIIFLYAIYLVFKRKQKKQKQQQREEEEEEEDDLLQKQPITKPTSKKKSSKRNKKPKKTNHISSVPRQRTRSTTMSSCSSEDAIVNRNPSEEKQVLVEILNSKDWINVGEKKRQPEQEEHEQDEGFADSSPTLSNCCTPTINKSDDQVHKSNWYSPFSTGLDLDILPKSTYTKDPLCLYHIQNTIIPNHHHLISTFLTPQKPTCIQLLENHPFISSPTSTTFKHNFGSIGDKIKKTKTLV